MKSNRRRFIQTVGAGAGSFTLGTAAIPLLSCANSSAGSNNDDEQILFIGDDIALADTQYGKVKGYVLRGINYFLGIPYGADTSGANRFMPPQKPEPWTDVYPAVWWGNSAPQNLEGQYARPYSAFADHWNYDDVSEDCLKLNVFTPGIADGKKRPVLVWFHGGVFTSGNSHEHDGYNGENISRKENIVFVSVNHRLGPMGFSNLAKAGGEKFASSGNVGALDLVAALEWVRDNIENFGGDPGSVTIMGQSGGGSKVKTVTGMPKAKGLFHKAITLSGFMRLWAEKEPSEELGEYILKEAGISSSEISKLQEMPWQEYYALANRASQKYATEAGRSGVSPVGWAPVIGTEILPQEPFFPPSSLTEDIPMIFCSTTEEGNPSRTDPELDNITMEGVAEQLKRGGGFGTSGFGDKSEEIVAAYARAFPNKRPIEIWGMIGSGRQFNVALADRKSTQRAPCYVAWFGWQPPLFNNRMRAFHCSDICFWFYNTDVMLTHTGGGKRPRELSDKMSATLAQFMRTGNPNGGGLPEWPRYTSEKGELMFLNDVSEAQNDPDREPRKLLPEVV